MDTQALKALIKAKGFTQEEFASKIGIHDTKLSRIINGQDEGSFAVFAKITEGLQLAPAQIWELLYSKKYEEPIKAMSQEAASLIKEIQSDIADLKKDRDKMFQWVKSFFN